MLTVAHRHAAVAAQGVAFAHAGIAAATALAGVLNAALLWRYLRQQGLYPPEPGWGSWLAAHRASACVVMAVAVLAVRGWVGDWTALRGVARWLWLLVAVGAGAAAYGAVAAGFGLRPRHLRRA